MTYVNARVMHADFTLATPGRNVNVQSCTMHKRGKQIRKTITRKSGRVDELLRSYFVSSDEILS